MSDSRFWKTVVVINGLVPLTLLAWDAYHGELGPNGVNYAIHTTGILSLIFLFLSLSITPVRLLTGWNALLGFRRALGLFGAFYACAHLGIYYGFDRALSLSSTINEILTRRFLQVGFVAILLMAPLAITSTNAMVARLGARRWKLLHRLAYMATGLGALHYYMQVKADVRQPLAFAAVLAVLLAARLVWHYVELRKAVKRAPAAAPSPNRRFWSGELRVARVFDETPEVRTFRLVAPDGGALPFDHLPGQYLNVQLIIDGRRVNRSYTIASPPTRSGYCEVSVKREDAGVASKHLHAHAHEGDRLKVSAPAGRFVFTGAESNGVVLVAGGVGITPMMSITRYLTDRGWTGDIYLMFVVKTAQDIIFRDELDWLQKRFPNLHVNVTLTRARGDDTWTGRRGRLTSEWLTQCVPDIAHKPAYICGPDEMMNAARELLLSLGVPETSIKIEAFVSPGVAALTHERAEAVDDSRDGPSNGEFAAASATFVRSGKTAEVAAGMTILEASESIGVNLPFECRSGVCGQCRVRLIEGAVSMDAEDALSAAEIKAGWILACQSHPRVDVTVDA